MTKIWFIHFYNSYHVRGSFLSKQVLNPRLHKDYISIEKSFDNYDGLTDPGERVQNMRCNLELIIQDNDSVYKILPTTFYGLSMLGTII
jgi:hypothetical protein